MEESATIGYSRCPLCGAVYVGSHACSRSRKDDWSFGGDTVEERLIRIEKKVDELVERIKKWKSSK